MSLACRKHRNPVRKIYAVLEQVFLFLKEIWALLKRDYEYSLE